MANTAHGWFVSMTLKDGGQKTSVVTLETSAVTAADAATASAATVAAYQALTNSIVMGFHVLQKYSVDGADATAATGGKEIQAIITASVEGNPLKNVSLGVSNPIDDIFLGIPGTDGYDIIDINNGLLDTYLELFKTAAGTTGLKVSDGERIQNATRGRRA